VREPAAPEAQPAPRLRGEAGARHGTLRRGDEGRAVPAARAGTDRGRQTMRRARHPHLLRERQAPGRVVRPSVPGRGRQRRAVPVSMDRLLRSSAFFYAATLALPSVYWWSAITKLLSFPDAEAEMAHFGLNPPALFAIGTIVLQLGASALVVRGGRLAWVGA